MTTQKTQKFKTSRKGTKFTFSPSNISLKIKEALIVDFGSDYSDTSVEQLYRQKYSEREIFCTRMIDEFTKKFTNEDTVGETPTSRAAKESFLDNVSRLCAFDPNLPAWIGGPYTGFKPDKRTVTLARARSFVTQVLGEPPTLEELFNAAKHSGGTTVGLKFTNTNVDDKFRFPISATLSQAKLLIKYFSWDPQSLEGALQNSAPVWRLIYELSPLDTFDIADGSTGTTVPKNDVIDRFICKETTAGMFFQKGLEFLLYQRFTEAESFLHRSWMDTACLQQMHRLRAAYASVTGADATIDWRNASDNWLRSVVSWLVSPQWNGLIESVGSPAINIKVDTKDYFVEMPMISTMGNATTFPLECLLFYAVCIATLSVAEDYSTSVYPEWADYSRRISVFGDDCIVPTIIFHDVIAVLESLGHQPNNSKSYADGYFRESCGGDYYCFRNVRPFNLRWPTSTSRKHDAAAWLCVVTNRLLEKYITYFGPRNYAYQSVFYVLADIFKTMGISPPIVPDDFPDDSGLKITGDFFRLPFKTIVDLECLETDIHGNTKFKYMSYKYPSKYCSEDHIRYWYRLKYGIYDDIVIRRHARKLVVSRSTLMVVEDDQRYLVKRGGYYVVHSTVRHWPDILPFTLGNMCDELRGKLLHCLDVPGRKPGRKMSTLTTVK